MAPIPKRPSTVKAIYEAYVKANEHFDSLGLSVGELGNECDRALFYSLRWASQPEKFDGRKLSIFRTGDMWEERLVADLEATGAEVYDQQDRIRFVGGHVRGKIDGKAIGIIEAPKTEHLCEFKSSNNAGFKEIVKKGCKEAKPLHYAQVQLGMHMFSLTRALYLVVDKNTDKRYSERIEYDFEYCVKILAKAERIIRMEQPPARLSDDPEFFKCKFCKHHSVCHKNIWPRKTCRTCIYSTPELDGDCHWSCGLHSKPLSVAEQKRGCDDHLHIPPMVPGGEQLDANLDEGWISYRMKSGEIWIDGGESNEVELV